MYFFPSEKLSTSIFHLQSEKEYEVSEMSSFEGRYESFFLYIPAQWLQGGI